eukprot:SAG31_NODE_870_length_11338_cov_14.525047_3_plen_69_part_00
MIVDALYEIRRKKHTKGAWTEQSLFHLLDSLCSYGVLRHGDERVDPVYEKCDAMMDENLTEIVAVRHC